MEVGHFEAAEQQRINCPGCGNHLAGSTCDECGREFSFSIGYADLIPHVKTPTASHYQKQWGGPMGFLKFIQERPSAKNVMAAAALGWSKLFQEIREKTVNGPASVYDAACGFGGIANELITEKTAKNLFYVGADIHGALQDILERIPRLSSCGKLLRWDISQPLPMTQQFDYVICRAAIHHTPDPEKTFAALCASLKPGGTLAISAYNKKSVCREANDDALRGIISKMSDDEAWETSRQFTVLGEALQKIEQRVTLPEDIPLLNLKKGEISVQSLVYYHLIKCFFNSEFGEKYSTLVNFDWYHPQWAYRYESGELTNWFEKNGLKVVELQSTEFQHYVVGKRLN